LHHFIAFHLFHAFYLLTICLPSKSLANPNQIRCNSHFSPIPRNGLGTVLKRRTSEGEEELKKRKRRAREEEEEE
jgi:hypothetical protein